MTDNRNTIAPPVFTAEYLEVLNELLRDAAPVGAYAVGIVTAAALQDELPPDRELLVAASRIADLADVDDVYQEWKARRL